MKTELSTMVKKFRKKRSLTQYQLADMVMADVSTVNKIENGKANPSFEMLKKLATALGVTVSELIGEQQREVS